MRLLALLAKSCVITSLIAAAAGGTGARGATYRVIDLGVLPGGTFSIANGINESDHVAGWSGTLEDTHAVIWRDGTMIDLGTLQGGSFSIASEINDVGQIAGEGDSHSVLRGFIWHNGVMTDLGEIPGGSRAVSTRGINNRGQIVGEAIIPAGEGIPTAGVAFLWMNGEFTDLGSLSTRRSSIAFEINDVTQVVGQSQVGNSSRGFIWQNGVMTDLGDLPGGADFSNAYGINNLGQVVGRSDSSAGMRAFLWEGGVMRPLGDVPGSTFVQAGSINDSGQVVGTNEIDGVRRALLWESASSAPQYLEDLVDESGALWSFEYAAAINNQGHIAGYGQFNGTTRAFLLVPEPATWILLVISALLVLSLRRHRRLRASNGQAEFLCAELASCGTAESPRCGSGTKVRVQYAHGRDDPEKMVPVQPCG